MAGRSVSAQGLKSASPRNKDIPLCQRTGGKSDLGVVSDFVAVSGTGISSAGVLGNLGTDSRSFRSPTQEEGDDPYADEYQQEEDRKVFTEF